MSAMSDTSSQPHLQPPPQPSAAWWLPVAAQLAASKATWQSLGNQDIMARMWITGSVVAAQSANPTYTAAIGKTISVAATGAVTYA